MTANPRTWQGIIPPIVTPLLSRDTLDRAGLTCLIEHILAGGVHGVFVLGTTGEAPSLPYNLRTELIGHVCEQVNGRVPVLVGITDTIPMESLKLTQRAAQLGSDAVVLAPPYYFPAGQPELIEYLQHLASELPIPLFLYNMPLMTKMVFEVDTVLKLTEDPNIIGIKDSSGDMMYFHKLLQKVPLGRPDFAMLVGPEELLGEAVLFGAHRGVCGGANLFPRLYVDLYDAAKRHDVDRVVALQKTVMQINATIYSVGQYSSSIIKGIKCGLSVLGICSDRMAEPFYKFKHKERVRIEQYVRDLSMMLQDQSED